jgi:hypothetical protein
LTVPVSAIMTARAESKALDMELMFVQGIIVGRQLLPNVSQHNQSKPFEHRVVPDPARKG